EVAAAAAIADAAHDDAAVGLEGDGVFPVVGAAEVGGDEAVVSERGVGTPVGGVAGDGEVVGAPGVADPGGQDSAVGLDGRGVGPVVGAAEVGDAVPPGAEAGIEVPGAAPAGVAAPSPATIVVMAASDTIHRSHVPVR